MKGNSTLGLVLCHSADMGEKTQRTEGSVALSNWLEGDGRSRGALARRLGCDIRIVRRWANGDAVPQTAYRERIAWLTEGAVTPEMWTRSGAAGSAS